MFKLFSTIFAMRSTPVPTRFGFHHQPREHRQKFGRTHLRASTLTARPGEATLIQSLGANPEPAAIPKKYLHPVALLVGKDKPMTGEGILLEHRLRYGKETVKPGSQVHRLRCHKNPRSRRSTQHGLCS